ncbi:MAG: restriction endonuclease subunit S [Bacteroidales bacterium]|nr:restriction endonuclease subunit S [Bacteroidales bacterium]
MSYLEKLLEGVEVEWKSLKEFADYEQPTKYLVKSTNYNDNFPTPVLTAGKTFILGYTDETKGIYKASVTPVIIFDDFTTANKWVDFDFKAKSSAMKMIISKDESKALLKYIYYWLNTLPSGLVDGDHKRQWISNYSNKQIPIPPLSVQKEIVRILDTFTELTAELTTELTTELTARKQQYSFYREELMSFEEGEVEWKTLGEVISLQRGKRLVKSQLEDTGNYAVYQNSMTPLGYYHESNVIANTTFIICAGAAGEIGFSDVPYWAADDVHSCITPDGIKNKFVYYCLLTQQHKISSQVRRASIPRLSKSVLEKLQIPIPPLKEQERIVSILDKFETLTNSISEGLPKEIELRQKQYEYYRDMLLTFPSMRADSSMSLRADSSPSLRAEGEAIQKKKQSKKTN